VNAGESVARMSVHETFNLSLSKTQVIFQRTSPLLPSQTEQGSANKWIDVTVNEYLVVGEVIEVFDRQLLEEFWVANNESG
jgi:hypothetical protein